MVPKQEVIKHFKSMAVKVVDETFNQEVWNAVCSSSYGFWKWGKLVKNKARRFYEWPNSESYQNNVFQITFHPIPTPPYCVAYMPRTVIPSQKYWTSLHVEAKKAGAIFIKIRLMLHSYMKTDKMMKIFF